jgi:long-chain-fatty-acid---luciferin-component ligase
MSLNKKCSEVVKSDFFSETGHFIFQDERQFFWDKDKIEYVQHKLLKNAFAWHYENCSKYQRYCDLFHVTPDDIKSYSDIVKIPLIPSNCFKSEDIVSVPREKIVKVCTSSGTQGKKSIICRDEITLFRFIGSIQAMFSDIIKVEDALILNLGPSNEESRDLWISYVISMADLIFPTRNYVQNGKLALHNFVNDLFKFRNSYKKIIIVGPPILYLQLFDYLNENNIKIDFGEKIIVITAGGWKKYIGNVISVGMFSDLAKKYLGITDSHNIRDILNMVELNAIIPECEYKVKHVFPWVKVFVFDPKTMKPVGLGKQGLLAYMDASAVSYPGFILSSDIGEIVTDSQCKCGRTGTGIRYIRRVNNSEGRGCALKMDKRYVVDKNK